MIWVVSRFRLKAPPGISSSCISPLTSSGQCSRTSWASHPQKSATLSPQPGVKPRKFIRTCGGIGKKKGLQCGTNWDLKYYVANFGYDAIGFTNKGMRSTSVNDETHNLWHSRNINTETNFCRQGLRSTQGTDEKYKFQLEILKETDHSDSFRIKGMLILKWISKSERMWSG